VRKSPIIQLVLLGVVIGAAAMVAALAIPWLPDVGSKEARRVDDLYLLTSVICLVIFAIVAAASLYAVIKFRARPGDDEDGKPIHGHTGLEALWTAIPAALVTVIAIYSGIVLVKNEDAVPNHRVIEVKAVQFAWSFTYPDLGVTTGVLRVPVGEQVELQMESEDVIHSFWVPEWRLKQDVVPGITTRYLITPDKPGAFPVICTELCGLGHATMRTSAVVLSSAAFDAWIEEERQAASAGGTAQGERVFADQGCGSCHVLAAAGATGQVGPSLDETLPGLSADAIRQSIADPNAQIAPGFQPGVMPPDYGEKLSDEQLDALVQYLMDATKG